MKTPNGRMIDNYFNRYDVRKKYVEMLLRDGYGTQASEINELQSMWNERFRALGDSLYKDGDVIFDAQITVNPETGLVNAQSGLIYLSGNIWAVDAASFTIPVKGTVAVGVRLIETIVSELEDPSLNNPATGSRGEGEPGAWRRKIEAVWSHDGEIGQGEFYPVHAVDDGVPRAKETPPNLDSFNQGLARYDRDSTGGNYICNGMVALSAGVSEAGAQIFTISEGRCRVNGFGVEMAISKRLLFDARPDLRFLDTEVVQADGSAKQRINVAHPPIHNITALHVTLQKTVTITHGNYTGCSDVLPDTSILKIREVRQGDTVYVQGTDYKKTGDAVDWSPVGNEPSTGSSIQVTYDYLDKTLVPEDVDFDGFSVSGAVADSSIMFSYNQALPRIDLICISPEGVFSFVTGVATEFNQKRPGTPEALLRIASIKQNWRGPAKIQVINDGVRMTTFEDWATQKAWIEYALAEISRQRLESDIATREAGAKKGMFVDPFQDDSMRDQGIEQNAAVVNGFLTLPISATVHGLSMDILAAKSRDYKIEVILDQPLRTDVMKINPYMAFAILPAKAKLNPAVDRWTETRTAWTSGVTQNFYKTIYAPRHPLHGKTVQDTTSKTELVSQSQTNIEHLRQIDIAFDIEGFGAGENLAEIIFDGIPVTPKNGPLSADANGNLHGVFTIPANVPAGSKLTQFRGQGGTTAQATFVGQGVLDVATYRTVQTVTNTRIDPVAQTFILNRTMQIVGADIWFTAKGDTGVRLQIREVSNGVPTRTVLAEAVVEAKDLVVTGGGHTRILFSAPVPLQGATEYALVILCNDPVTEVAVAELGRYDALHQQWVAAQSYVDGVLLSSSNASTWTAHQNRDLTFRLLAATYTEGADTLNLGTAGVPEQATDFILMSLAETPSSRSRVEYELVLPDGESMTIADGQTIRLSAALTGPLGVKAKLSGDSSASPVLWPGTQIIAGKIHTEAKYYARSVAATGATRAILIYCAEIPSGASVIPEIQVDGGAWQAMTPGDTTPQDEKYVEYTFTKTLSQADVVKLRLTLAGAISARPMVYGLRFMTV